MASANRARHSRLQRLGAAVAGLGVLGVMMPYPTHHAPEPEFPARPTVVRRLPIARVEPTEALPLPIPATPSAAVPPADPAAPEACPQDMVLVAGLYCTEVRHRCLEWLDDETLPFARCKRYASTATCVGERVEKRFCIDRFESADADGMPVNHMSFHLAGKRCREQNKRLCTESEWNFACEGEAMSPYPYGIERQPKCNQDRADLYEPNPKRRILADRRIANDPTSPCVSPFGVINMVGNLDEPVVRETAQQPGFHNALKGGWWMAGRNRCRPSTTAHDDYYRDTQIGVRCCADAAPAAPP